MQGRLYGICIFFLGGLNTEEWWSPRTKLSIVDVCLVTKPRRKKAQKPWSMDPWSKSKLEIKSSRLLSGLKGRTRRWWGRWWIWYWKSSTRWPSQNPSLSPRSMRPQHPLSMSSKSRSSRRSRPRANRTSTTPQCRRRKHWGWKKKVGGGEGRRMCWLRLKKF